MNGFREVTPDKLWLSVLFLLMVSSSGHAVTWKLIAKGEFRDSVSLPLGAHINGGDPAEMVAYIDTLAENILLSENYAVYRIDSFEGKLGVTTLTPANAVADLWIYSGLSGFQINIRALETEIAPGITLGQFAFARQEVVLADLSVPDTLPEGGVTAYDMDYIYDGESGFEFLRLNEIFTEPVIEPALRRVPVPRASLVLLFCGLVSVSLRCCVKRLYSSPRRPSPSTGWIASAAGARGWSRRQPE